ncbi:S1C family serine protease [Stappia sp. MMSF_3263]|uniref:S1C family serine protease n=1 Tax=Stappia sp. MMSF_3263 TaxID=3046693 RepID=UPI00273F83DB|nr:trypsin-like peptidase domain-containing protein [Stappia sp. MMSF_3263]
MNSCRATRLIRAVSGMVAIAVVAGHAAPAAAQLPTAAQLERARASVVAVLPDWPDGRANAEEPEGSAVAIGDGTMLLTADHVLGAARSVRLRFPDGRVVAAEIAFRDAPTDLALLRAPVTLEPLAFGTEPSLGAPVCALGNAFGLGISLSCGVVSATARGGVGFNAVEDFIQTDAAVNPGASGGALVDGEGRLVGVLSAIFTKSGDGDIGVNFAVSASLAQRVVEAAAISKSPRRSLGARLRQTPPGPQKGGLEVVSLEAGGAAQRAGLLPGDVILSIDGVPAVKLAGFRGRLERDDAKGVLTVRRAESELQVELGKTD